MSAVALARSAAAVRLPGRSFEHKIEPATARGRDASSGPAMDQHGKMIEKAR
jgi:hypothetical protein